MENWGRKALMAVAVLSAVNTGQTAEAGPVSDVREAHARIQGAARDACNDAARAAREYSGRELSDELLEIDGRLREDIQDEDILWPNVRRDYEAGVERLIRSCAVTYSRTYDDLGGPATPRKD